MLFPDIKELIKLKSVINCSAIISDKTGNRSQGDYASLFHGLGVEFETVRPYVVGDDVRYIDWRVTARIGKPQVKTFRAESDRNVLIVVDANAYMRFGTRGTFKSVQAARTAALLCWKSVQQQDRVGGLVFGDIERGIQYFKPTKTDSASLRLLKSLCNTEINTENQVPISNALSHLAQVVTPQSLVFIISDFSVDQIQDLEKSLIALNKKCKLVLLPVSDISDKEIPDIGSIIFVNGGQRELIDTENTMARSLYSKSWLSYQLALQQVSKKLKAPLLWIDTNIDPVKSLAMHTGLSQKWKS
jgi:uncharacterized protein (DUF58 family)